MAGRYKFVADDIEVLNPPDSVKTVHKLVFRVTYGKGAKETVVGHVRLRRAGKSLLGDFSLFCSARDTDKAFQQIRQLYPATAYSVKRDPSGRLYLKIDEVFLTPHPNHDSTIQPLGDRLRRRLKAKDMH
jgi:hypothetical protein